MSGNEPSKVVLLAPLAFDYSPDANAIQQPLQLGRRFDTTLVVPWGVVVPEEIAAGCRVVAAGHRPHGAAGWRLSYLRGAARIAAAAAGDSRSVIVGTSDQFAATAACRIGRRRHAPWIWLCWDHPFGSRYRRRSIALRIEKWLRTQLLRRTVRSASAVVLMYAPEGLEFLNVPQDRTVAVGNGVLFGGLRRVAESVPKRPGLVVAVGGLSWDKGADLILDAFEIVAAAMPEARLRLLGALGPAFRQEFEARISRPSLAGKVEWCGDLPFDEAMRLAAEGQVGLCAYRPLDWLQYNEVLKIGEYQALGIVPVAHDLPGTRRLVHDGYDGRLVPVGNARAMAAAVFEILGDDTRRAGLAAASVAAARKRDWDIIGEEVADVVRRVATGDLAPAGLA